MDICQDEGCPNYVIDEPNNCITFKQVSECPTPDYLNSNEEPVVEVPCSDRVMPRFTDKMHIDFERYVSSNLNWPIERTGSAYHDERTDGAWKVFKFAKVA